ncbi:hypothetical protein [Campylobacter estrildidarum]|uniref:Sec-independent protein translocase subunit TatA2 n=1 Tax=Campylobacter estrildidarum TaxID=2510189 RepID=A0A4U7BPC8_9BACT|nr:hypothetical protein [Campylobacter estrildidarum]TKX29937.1 hypothetical protein CQA69_07130 [Campylobacter estrildidarum]
MIFLIPLLLIVAILFGIDYLYFGDENSKAKAKLELKQESNPSLEQEKKKYLDQLFKPKS